MFYISALFRYCVLLITGDEESFSSGNQAFLSFASFNTKEVVRFAYVYQRLQQPLCDALMDSKDGSLSAPQVFFHERGAKMSSYWQCVHRCSVHVCAGGDPGETQRSWEGVVQTGYQLGRQRGRRAASSGGAGASSEGPVHPRA